MEVATQGLTRRRSSKHGYAFALAVLVAFRFVFELLVAEEELFTGGENKIRAAINALENLVLVFHLKVRSQRDLLAREDPDREPGSARGQEIYTLPLMHYPWTRPTTWCSPSGYNFSGLELQLGS